MPGKYSGSLTRLANVREAILELARLERELHEALKGKMQKEGLDIAKVCHGTKIGWTDVRDFLTQRHVICHGLTLERLTRFVDRPDLRDQIEQAQRPCGNDRQKGLAVLPPEVITLALDLEVRRLSAAPPLPREEYAKLFGPLEEVVSGVLLLATDFLQKLAEEQIRTTLRAALDSPEWSARVEQSGKDRLDRLQAKGRQLEELVDQLRKRFPEHRLRAQALGCARNTLTSALQGEVGEQTLDQLLEKACELTGTPPEQPAATKAKPTVPPAPSKPKPRPAPAASTPQQVVKKEATVDELLGQFGGETSALGVKYVIGPASEKLVDGEPSAALLAIARRSIELARGLLNLLSQLQDPETRKRIRELLGPEVQELFLATKRFSFSHPNRLTEILNEQRETWLAESHAERKGGGSKP